MKIYCQDCQYHAVNREAPGWDLCYAPKNQETVDTYFKPHQKLILAPEKLNAQNDCKLFVQYVPPPASPNDVKRDSWFERLLWRAYS